MEQFAYKTQRNKERNKVWIIFGLSLYARFWTTPKNKSAVHTLIKEIHYLGVPNGTVCL